MRFERGAFVRVPAYYIRYVWPDQTPPRIASVGERFRAKGPSYDTETVEGLFNGRVVWASDLWNEYKVRIEGKGLLGGEVHRVAEHRVVEGWSENAVNGGD